jgi:molybdopterin-containing oxidoreductase family iron-sulfur binding subunit
VLCHWHVPAAHYLESWSDSRAFDGTASIVQPLIAPLYGGRSVHELLAALLGESESAGHEIVRGYWWRHWPKGHGDFERGWEKALHDGVIPGTTFVPRNDLALRPLDVEPPARAPAGGNLEIAFRPDPTIYDGRFANNGWLQELPKPVSKLTWDNAAFVSPATAQRLGLSQTFGARGGEHGQAIVDLVELSYCGRTVRAPAWILPGHPDDAVTITFGYGRTRAGSVGGSADHPVGFDAYQLRASTAPWFDSGLQVRRTGERYTLACTQMHHAMEGRDPVRAGTLEQYREHPHFVRDLHGHHHADFQEKLVPKPLPEAGKDQPAPVWRQPLSMYPAHDYGPPKQKWGMAIDLTTCVGCNTCVVACQAENNIPVVGKSEVTRGREMHWLRIDRYYVGGLDNPTTYFQPVPCMHCENAPCELVCPVAATVHSADGLNDMIYNRCVGTRYCSNNCPYKVRRFNFLQYANYATGSLKLGRNPEVTVRSRGVMEKCTYCVQRIRVAQIESEVQGRPLRDGDVLTACQAACPAGAIVFGDLNDPNSEVSRIKSGPLDYGLLAELNTRPRTTYLAALRNPNPELAKIEE